MAAQALSTRVLAAETSTHLESATALHRQSRCKLARSVGAPSLRRLRRKGKHLHAGDWSWRRKHSPLKCSRQRRARTLSPPPPFIVEQVQACSISRSFITAAPSQRQTPSCRCLVMVAQALSTRVPEAELQRRARTLSPPPSCPGPRIRWSWTVGHGRATTGSGLAIVGDLDAAKPVAT